MTKTARAFYSTAVPHREMNDLYQASFGIPGLPPAWVTGLDGRPKAFINSRDAEIAGFRMMMSKLNRSRDIQSFGIKGSGHGIKAGTGQIGNIKAFRASDQRKNEPTVQSVFGKK